MLLFIKLTLLIWKMCFVSHTRLGDAFHLFLQKESAVRYGAQRWAPGLGREFYAEPCSPKNKDENWRKYSEDRNTSARQTATDWRQTSVWKRHRWEKRTVVEKVIFKMHTGLMNLMCWLHRWRSGSRTAGWSGETLEKKRARTHDRQQINWWCGVNHNRRTHNNTQPNRGNTHTPDICGITRVPVHSHSRETSDSTEQTL